MKGSSVRLLACVLLFCNGCGLQGEKEPEGNPVLLTQEELHLKGIKEHVREWYAWHTKGLELNIEGRYEEALYCFHQALKAWPKTVDESQEHPTMKHRPESTTTLLQLALLYTDLNEPQWALYYFDKFESYVPNEAFVRTKRKIAKEMLKQPQTL